MNIYSSHLTYVVRVPFEHVCRAIFLTSGWVMTCGGHWMSWRIAWNRSGSRHHPSSWIEYFRCGPILLAPVLRKEWKSWHVWAVSYTITVAPFAYHTLSFFLLYQTAHNHSSHWNMHDQTCSYIRSGKLMAVVHHKVLLSLRRHKKKENWSKETISCRRGSKQMP